MKEKCTLPPCFPLHTVSRGLQLQLTDSVKFAGFLQTPHKGRRGASWPTAGGAIRKHRRRSRAQGQRSGPEHRGERDWEDWAEAGGRVGREEMYGLRGGRRERGRGGAVGHPAGTRRKLFLFMFFYLIIIISIFIESVFNWENSISSRCF